MMYETGSKVFARLREWFLIGRVDTDRMPRIKIEFNTRDERDDFTLAIRRDSPPMPVMSRPSSAQAGNHSGTWFGIPYEFTYKGEPPR